MIAAFDRVVNMIIFLVQYPRGRFNAIL